MVEKFFKGLTEACRRVDPNHLNLGIRYYTIPPAWALAGMHCFDVFSMNCYDNRIRSTEMAKLNSLLNLPVLVGEWHFGALTWGFRPRASARFGIRPGAARRIRVYTEDAASKPWCVGVHYFTLYDQSALGRWRRRELQHRFPGRLQSTLRTAGSRRPREPRKAVPGGAGPGRTLQRSARIRADTVLLKFDGDWRSSRSGVDTLPSLPPPSGVFFAHGLGGVASRLASAVPPCLIARAVKFLKP